MNHTYRLVWNQGAQRHVPAAEVGRRRGKTRGRKVLVRCSILLAAVLCAVHGNRSVAAPTGGSVVAGQGTISQNGNNTTVQQQTQSLSLDWTSFSIGPSETVQFVQPSSTAIALNRVVGNEPSQIYGHLSANGQVFLINTNGVLFGSSAQVNVGSLVASSLNITDADFLSGNYRFQSTMAGATPASVINQGVINASAGSSIALLGGQVSNQGIITARLGTVALAAGSAMTLEFNGSRLLSVQVDQAAAGALAENRQLIQADGGTVIMTAAARDALLNTVVNNTGVIEARTIQNQGGEISLLGGADGGTVNVEGTLDASAPNGGNGGTIETSGAHVQVADSAHISTAAAQGKTGSWVVDPTDFTIAPSGGDISGATLSTELATTNVVLSSSSGAVSGNGDIFVDDVVNWSANTLLVLIAGRNIVFNSSITATGNSAGLGLSFGGSYSLNYGSSITLSGSNPTLTINNQGYAVINSLGVAGDTSITTLQGMNSDLSGYYALGSNINASASGGFSTGGFVPIGTSSQPFTGTLAGLGHTIVDLTIDPSVSPGGLFGYTAAGSVIRDVGIDGATVASTGNAYVGALVGQNYGTIENAYANATVSGGLDVGGLVGQNYGSITNSYTTGTVSGTNEIGGLVGENHGTLTSDNSTANVSSTSEVVGGLVGDNYAAISGSYATGTVQSTGYLVGGLVGVSEQGGSIVNSYATGSVTGQSNAFEVGGLAGENLGTISGSYATGNVTATGSNGGYVGGLVGLNNITGTISTSYYLNPTGQVNGGSFTYVGGLIGYNGGSVDQSYAATNVVGGSAVGGLIGYAQGYSSTAVTQSYATGSVSGTDDTGGLIGTSSAETITDCYAASSVSISGSGFSGGFIGAYINGTITSSYWLASGSTTDTSGAIELTTAQAEQESSYANWNFSGVWRIYNGHTAPLLETFLTPLTITIGDSLAYYDGVAYDYDLAFYDPTYSIPGAANSSHLYGVSSPYGAARNAGTYTATLWSDQQGYDITVLGGVMTIDKTNLVISTSNIVRAYNGTTSANGNPVAVDSTTLAGTDTLSGGTFAFTDPNAGSNKTVTVSGVTVNDGNGGNNYNVTYVNNITSTINQASLTLTAGSSTKVYDGTTSSTGAVTETGAVAGQTVSATESYASKNVLGTGGSTLQVNSGYTITDASGADMSGNYTVSTVTAAGTITPAALTLAAGGATKTYDGTTSSTGAVTETGAVLGDSVNATESYTSKNVLGTGGSTLLVNSGYTITDASGADMSGNYTITTTAAAGTITPAALTLAAGGATKTYDGTTASTGTVTETGAVLGDSVNATESYTSKNVLGTGGSTLLVNSGYTITDASGADMSGNYTITTAATTGTITPASLTITSGNVVKTYDGTTSAAGSALVTGGTQLFSTDAISGGTFAFTDPNAGSNKSVTVSAVTVNDGNGGNNYSVTYVDNTTSTINKASLTLVAGSATKTYDGTTASTGTVTETGAVTGDSVSATESYASKNALGTGGSTLLVNNGYTITDAGGADMSGNYTITTATAAGTINPAVLSVSGATAANKVYDGGVAATISGGSLGGVIGSDSVSLAEDGYFSDKNAGTNKSVSEIFGLTGNDAQNYILANSTAQTTANITPKTLTVSSGITANDKTYDGTTAATLNTSGATLTGEVSGDSLGVSGVGTFVTPNAGTNRAVTLSNLTLTGTDSGNYVLATSGNESSTTANITAAALTITANNATKVAGASNPALTVTYSGFATGDGASSLTPDPTVSTTASTNSPAGTYTITALGADDPNYTINYVAGTLTVTSSPATAVTSSPGYVGALSSVTQPASSLTLTDPIAGNAGDSGDLKSKSDDSEIYNGMLDIDTPKRVTEALPILALIILDKGIKLPEGVQ